MKAQHRPVEAVVDLAAIGRNVERLAAHARGAQVMAVVKADGYGHGAVPVARAALAGGAAWLGVALVEEGEALRRAGISAPILVMSEPPVAAAGALLAADLTPTLYTREFGEALLAASSGPVEVHVKVDTGMRRVGVPEGEWPAFHEWLRGRPRLRVASIWSHLAVADEPGNPSTDTQLDAYRDALAVHDRPVLRHLANSAGTTLRRDTHFDLVRTGIAVYGLESAPGVRLEGLEPALAWRAELSLVKRVPAGKPVSYGHRWASPVDTWVGTVPAGYADGVRRALSNSGQALHAGRRVGIVGTVCMDQLLVDLGRHGGAAGDDLWLIGGPGEDAVTAADWARWLGTITYEVVCGIGRRVPRRYVGEP